MSLVAKLKDRLANRTYGIRKDLLRRMLIGSARVEDDGRTAASFNRTQKLFVKWNAERLGISEEESLARYLHSWNVVPDGHRGVQFDLFLYLNQEIFSVFFGNSGDELFDTYRFHGYRDLLRQIVLPEPVIHSDHPILRGVADLPEVVILDYGCGLAQRSRALAEYLQSRGTKVQLHLVDIPSVEFEFLEWISANGDLSLNLLPATREEPIPDLPACHVLIATEFFEHVRNPLEYFARFDEVLQNGGFLWTDVADHEEGFLHVTPILEDLRQEMARRGYRDLEPNVLLQKGDRIG